MWARRRKFEARNEDENYTVETRLEEDKSSYFIIKKALPLHMIKGNINSYEFIVVGFLFFSSM